MDWMDGLQMMPTDLQIATLRPAVLDYFSDHMVNIPTLSGHSSQVMALADRVMDVDIGEIVKLVRTSPDCSAALLKTANSAAHHRGKPAQGIDEAIVRLGRHEVYAVLMATVTRSLFEPKMRALRAVLPEHWYKLQHHAVVCAFSSASLLQGMKLGAYEKGFLGGMFRDIGKVGVLYCLGSLMLREEFDFSPSNEAIGELFETMHVDVGEAMVSHWRLPAWLVDLCATQRDPAEGPDALKHVVGLVSCLDTMREGTYATSQVAADAGAWAAGLTLDDNALEKLKAQIELVATKVSAILC